MSSDENPLEPPEYYDGDGSTDQSAANVQSASHSEILLVKDCNPWTTSANEKVLDELNVGWERIDSGALAETDLSDYSILVLPSTQPTQFYDNIIASKDAIESFVANGGVLVSHVFYLGWPCETTNLPDTYLPQEVEIIFDANDEVMIRSPDHPIMDGIERRDLGELQANLSHFDNVPEDAEPLIWDHENDRPSYIEYTHGAGLVLATGQAIEWPWYTTDSPYAPNTKEFLRNELHYALKAAKKRSQQHVTASLTTLQFIPGKEENPSREGHPLESGLMQIIPGEDPPVWAPFSTLAEVGAEPVFDSWLGGDMRDKLPVDLEDARKKKFNKYEDDRPGESFNEYRFENGVNVSFEWSTDGGIDIDTVDIKFIEAGSSGSRSFISRGDRKPSATVLHDHDLNGIPWREWYGTNVRRSNREPRYFDYDTGFEFNGVEGVRVVTVWGGWAGFMEDVARRASRDPGGFLATIWDWNDDFRGWILRQLTTAAPEEVHYLLEVLTTVPRNFTFLDFIVLADGRRYAKIWDSSPYPSRYTYLDKQLRDRYDMRYEPREQFNLWMTVFHARAITGVTPHSNKSIDQYMRFLRTQVKLTEIGEDDLPDDFKRDPWSVRFRDYLETLMEIFGLEDDKLEPVSPRTLGFHADGEPVGNPDAPFPPVDELQFPGTNELPSN